MDNVLSAETTFSFEGDLPITRLGFGAMRITGPGLWGPPTDRPAMLALLRRAVELGVTFIDTADMYGPFVSEELLAEALHPYVAELVIGTKGGCVRFGPEPTVQHFAEALHVSPAYLGDVLRTYTGQNAQQHLHYVLLEKARRLLSGTSLSIRETAFHLGFDNPSYFSRLFKHKTGFTPAEFRQSA